jgi:hypothetical protein
MGGVSESERERRETDLRRQHRNVKDIRIVRYLSDEDVHLSRMPCTRICPFILSPFHGHFRSRASSQSGELAANSTHSGTSSSVIVTANRYSG